MQASTRQFEFHGKAGEFFKIWIVNIMLSIVTLGIYSAWAKVRTKRYFYSNTLLMNTPFDYMADPIKILKGRLLAVGVVLIYSVISTVSPTLGGILFLLLLFVVPWIIIKSLKFNFYNSAYRNIRFHFDATYLKALVVFLGFPFLVPLTLGLAFPAFVRAQKRFIIDHSAFGASQFAMTATTGQFYKVYLKTAGILVLAVILIGIIFSAAGLTGGVTNDPSTATTLGVVSILCTLPLLIAFYGYIYTSISNLVINHTELEQCRFESHLETSKIIWLYLSNTLAIIFSLGLLIPWAKIRITAYRLSCLSVVSDSNLDSFIAGTAEKDSALGEELDDILDLDIGL
ncbi:MAG: YjgN family protein [Gammaproteobacteria bacterium]